MKERVRDSLRPNTNPKQWSEFKIAQNMRRVKEGNVLLISGVKGDTRRYRTIHPFEQLKLAGVECALSHITHPDLHAQVARANIILFHRIVYDRYIASLMDITRHRNKLTILDTDDLLFDPGAFQWIDSPDFQDPVRAALYQEDMRRSRVTLDRCDAVITSTGYLAEQVKQAGKPAWVHRNAFSLEMLKLAQAAYRNRNPHPGKLVIGYASGTRTHDKDFAVVKPVLRHILQTYSHTELWLVGPLDPGSDWGALHKRIRKLKLVHWRDLPTILSQFDINLAPLLTSNPFALSKSEIKYIEAALVHIPTVAASTEAFKTAISHGQNGFLAQGAEAWFKALTRLIENPSMRKDTGETAYHHTLANYHPAIRARELLETLNEIISYFNREAYFSFPAAPTPATMNAVRIPQNLEEEPSIIRMGLYTLRNRGIKTLGMQIWIYIRRLLEPVWPFREQES